MLESGAKWGDLFHTVIIYGLLMEMDFQKANTEITRFGTMPSIVRLQEAIDPEICIYNNHQTTLECLLTPL